MAPAYYALKDSTLELVTLKQDELVDLKQDMNVLQTEN